MHLTYKISGDDSCIVAIKWHNGLLCGRKTLPAKSYLLWSTLS